MDVEFTATTGGSSENPNKRPRPDEEGEKKEGAPGGNLGKKQADNLDFRVRQVENCCMITYRVAKDKWGSDLWKHLFTAKSHYDSLRQGKGVAHPHGGEHRSLILAVLQILGKQNEEQMKNALLPQASNILDYNMLAATVNAPTIEQQHAGLHKYVHSLKAATAREAMDDICSHFQWTETKKRDAMLLRFQLRANTPQALCQSFLQFLFVSQGGERLDGTAPRGPLFHQKKDKKK